MCDEIYCPHCGIFLDCIEIDLHWCLTTKQIIDLIELHNFDLDEMNSYWCQEFHKETKNEYFVPDLISYDLELIDYTLRNYIGSTEILKL